MTLKELASVVECSTTIDLYVSSTKLWETNEQYVTRAKCGNIFGARPDLYNCKVIGVTTTDHNVLHICVYNPSLNIKDSLSMLEKWAHEFNTTAKELIDNLKDILDENQTESN